MLTHSWRIIGYILLLGTLLSCGVFSSDQSRLKPPPTFRESDLIGTWQFDDVYVIEKLLLHADHTFTQIHDTHKARPVEVHGTWRVEYRPSGCVYIHLDGMRYFYSTSDPNNGNRYPDGRPQVFWEHCEERGIEMLDKVIIRVGSGPDFPRGLILFFPKANTEGTDVFMLLN
jgi:hypothetical protein